MSKINAKKRAIQVTPSSKKWQPEVNDLRQTTLTQCYPDEDESSDEEMLQPIKKKRGATAAVQGSVTVNAMKRVGENNLLVGDLVMSTAKNIHHPAYDEGRISASFLFIGCVTGFRIRRVSGGDSTIDADHVYVNWMNVETEGYRYQDAKDGNQVYDDDYRCFNIFVNFDFVQKDKLNLIARCDNNNVDKINQCMIQLIWNNFWHGSERGWKKILPSD